MSEMKAAVIARNGTRYRVNDVREREGRIVMIGGKKERGR